MQIIIPMSGYGERFREKGVLVPKPLISVEGKPMIAHIIDLFPAEINFIFICNQEHLDNPNYQLQQVLKQYCPTGIILGIKPHKLGPVYAVQQALPLIDPSQPVIINYCDFTCYWDWANFKRFIHDSGCSGAIPAYRGFHPHSLGCTRYAYLKESNGWVSAIQEKKPYTENPINEYASSGTYYFATGTIMIEAITSIVQQQQSVNGEYYFSTAYNELIKKHKSVAVYPLQHFMQWGTPEDLADYQQWSALFRRLLLSPTHSHAPQGTIIIPMAGRGLRFQNTAYSLPKPLIPVSGKAMVLQAVHDLPVAQEYVFIMQSAVFNYQPFIEQLKKVYPLAIIKCTPEVTQGQCCSALLGLEALKAVKGEEPSSLITISACDNGVLYSEALLTSLLDDQEVDVIVWGVRNHPAARLHPTMYSWIEVDSDNFIRKIAVKSLLPEGTHAPMVIGTFTFRRAIDFRRCAQRLIDRGSLVNDEFYLDDCINDAITLGLRCRLFEVDHYMSWGTPNELQSFEYWQSCFHKWESHPYCLKKDPHIEPKDAAKLSEHYRATIPTLPGPRS